MKTKPQKIKRDPLIQKLVTSLKKKGIQCGFGDEMEKIRKSK